MPDLHENFRMDFKIEILDLDESTGTARFVLRPDPDRYEWIDDDEGRALFDRFDQLIIPEHIIEQAASNMAGIPIGYAPPEIDNAATYLRSRVGPIRQRLSDGSAVTAYSMLNEPLADPSGELLAELAGHRLNFAIISIDLVGSTSLSTSMDPNSYALLIEALAYEVSRTAPLFRAHVLKFTGDGALLFVPGPSVNTQNDLAIDLALTLRALVYEVFNPLLAEAGMPRIDVRLGLDSGEAAIRVLGSPTTKRHADLIGDAVSLACKVEARGHPGEITVGGIAARSMHTHWRQMLTEVEPDADWPYTDEYGHPYPVYRVDGGDRNAASHP
jgi:class 3 adenylate cyclase